VIRWAISVAIAAGAAALAGGARGDVPATPHVLVIGDSVGTGITWHTDATAVAERGLDVDWQVAVCRRLIGVSCADATTGEQPPTAVELIDSMESVPQTVVVEMGYNDYEDTFAEAIDETMQSLVPRGATHVLWLTLHTAEAPYPALNLLLDAAAKRWPQLDLVNWDRWAYGHAADWFQDDGTHLLDAGGVAMAHLIHGSVVNLFSPLRDSPATLPPLRRGHPYTASLEPAGGTPPYRFRVVAGAPPRGIHLLADGRIYGEPRSNAALRFTVRLTDADGMSVVTRLRASSAHP
jgi:hypothetical protein